MEKFAAISVPATARLLEEGAHGYPPLRLVRKSTGISELALSLAVKAREIKENDEFQCCKAATKKSSLICCTDKVQGLGNVGDE